MAKKSLHVENIELKKQLAEAKKKCLKYDEELRKIHRLANGLVKELDENWDEICKLKDKIYDLQADKDGLIEFVKKQRSMLMHSEDEIARLKDENMNLMQNIQALGATFQENDQAYYKLIETNAFLAGQVKAYENASKSDAAETAH